MLGHFGFLEVSAFGQTAARHGSTMALPRPLMAPTAIPASARPRHPGAIAGVLLTQQRVRLLLSPEWVPSAEPTAYRNGDGQWLKLRL